MRLWSPTPTPTQEVYESLQNLDRVPSPTNQHQLSTTTQQHQPSPAPPEPEPGPEREPNGPPRPIAPTPNPTPSPRPTDIYLFNGIGFNCVFVFEFGEFDILFDNNNSFVLKNEWEYELNVNFCKIVNCF